MDRPDGSPTAVDVVLRPEWAAVEGTDKDFYASDANQAFGAMVNFDYLVPAGKSFYVCEFSGICHATLAASGDLPSACSIELWDATTGLLLIGVGGVGGVGLVFPKPKVIPPGHLVSGQIFVWANHACDVRVCYAGYEV